MTSFLKITFFILFLTATLSRAQTYVDIDLSPPKPPTKENRIAEPERRSQDILKKPPAAKSVKQKTISKPTPTQEVAQPILNKTITKPTTLKPVTTPQKITPTEELKLNTKVTTPTTIPARTLSLPRDPVPASPQKPTPPIKPAAPLTPILPKTEPTPIAPIEQKSTSEVDVDGVRFKNRHALSIDYSTWYEMFKMTEMTSRKLTESNSHYFGVAFSYDYTIYREKYGFAFSLGGVTGNAQAGTKDSGDYYERRVPWTGYRGGGRLFFRASNRIDLGFGFVAQSKTTAWPQSNTFSIIPQPNPQYFYYLDSRWRLNYRYELIQSFGAHLRSYALAWMLGISYTLN